jgi:type IV pilus assembly protein PilE
MKTSTSNGFTLIELLIAIALVGILLTIALPNYTRYTVRASRAAAQSELLALAALQEKIYLNSSNYAYSITNPYNGTASATSGLGRTTGKTQDAKYSLSLDISTAAQTYTLTATPITGSIQADDGPLSIDQSGKRLWGAASW